MNGAQSGPGNSRPAKTEDIDSVMGRFQDWARTQGGQGKSPDGRAPSVRKSSLGRGARELTYEEALRASSFRRPAYSGAVGSAPIATSPSPESAEPVSGAPADRAESFAESKPPGKSGTVVAAAGAAGSKAMPGGQQGVHARASAEAASLRAAAKLGADRPPLAPLGNKSAPANGRSVSARNRRNRPSAARKSAPQVHPGPVPQAVRPKAEAVAPQAVPFAPARTQPSQPAFREVLAATTALAASDGAEMVAGTKSVALSLRVSDAEQARIQACAARANLSVSAYLRQCALGVDVLRGQVEIALGELHKQEAQPAEPPGLSAIPGILGRFATRCLRRLRGRSDYTAVTLR